MLLLDDRHYRHRLPAPGPAAGGGSQARRNQKDKDKEVSPFDTTSWWHLPNLQAKPPPPLVRWKRYSKGEIERLRQEEERRAMELEDELSRGAAYALLMQLAREREAYDMEEIRMLSEFLPALIDEVLSLAMSAVDVFNHQRAREKRQMAREDKLAAHIRSEERRRRAMQDYQKYAQARLVAGPRSEGKRAVFISWSCQSCGYRNQQLIYVCFKCRTARRIEEEVGDEEAARRREQREAEEEERAAGSRALRVYGLAERQRALVGVAVIEDAARRRDGSEVLQAMAGHRGLADVQAAGASALAATMVLHRSQGSSPAYPLSRKWRQQALDAVLLGARSDPNHVYLQRAAMEALLPLAADETCGPLPVLPTHRTPPSPASDGECSRPMTGERLASTVHALAATACRSMRRFPTDTIVHAKGARLLHWLITTLADFGDDDESDDDDGGGGTRPDSSSLLWSIKREGAAEALRLTMAIHKFWSQRTALRVSCMAALAVLEERCATPPPPIVPQEASMWDVSSLINDNTKPQAAQLE